MYLNEHTFSRPYESSEMQPELDTTFNRLSLNHVNPYEMEENQYKKGMRETPSCPKKIFSQS